MSFLSLSDSGSEYDDFSQEEDDPEFVIDIDPVKKLCKDACKRNGLGGEDANAVTEAVLKKLIIAAQLKDPCLLPHQISGLAMIWAVTEIRAIRDVSSDADDPVAQGVLLAHDMGLGKTLTASVAVWVDHVLDRKGGTSLFILPPAVVNQWYRQLKQLVRLGLNEDGAVQRLRRQEYLEMHKFTTANSENRTYVKNMLDVDGSHNGSTPSFILISIEMLKRAPMEFWQGLPQLRHVVIDEAHLAGHSKTNVTQALACMRAGTKIAISGTPMQNNITELNVLLAWLHTCSRDDADEMTVRLTKGGLEMTTRLLERSCSRWTMHDAGMEMEMGSAEYTQLRIELSAEHVQINRAIDASHMSYLGKVGLQRQIMLDWRIIYRLTSNKWVKQQITAKRLPPLPAGGELEKLSPVVQQLVDSLLQCKARGEKAVVFTDYDSEVDILYRACSDTTQKNKLYVVTYTGKQDTSAKLNNLALFERHGDVALVNKSCGGTGLNMQCANNVYLLSVDYNPFNELQAIGRVHRIAQSRSVRIVCVTLNSELDGSLQSMQVEKISNEETVLGHNRRSHAHLDRNELATATATASASASVSASASAGPSTPKKRRTACSGNEPKRAVTPTKRTAKKKSGLSDASNGSGPETTPSSTKVRRSSVLTQMIVSGDDDDNSNVVEWWSVERRHQLITSPRWKW